MKKILIVNSVLNELNHNKNIIIKKNKTIIKDESLMKMWDKIESKYLLEEWEYCRKNEIQVICANNGDKLRPVHIITDLCPNNGVKALFQGEKLITIRISLDNKICEICKNIIDENNEMIQNVILITKFNGFDTIIKESPPNFIEIIKYVGKNYEKCTRGEYLSPLWYKND
jgi:hypothetical protein